jgi:uncharacterized protein
MTSRNGLFGLLLALLASGFPVAPASAQSFNCRYAKTAVEVLICQDAELSTLDARMASAYFELRGTLSGADRRDLEASQRAFLRQRNDCGRDRRCVADAYEDRIRQLGR